MRARPLPFQVSNKSTAGAILGHDPAMPDPSAQLPPELDIGENPIIGGGTTFEGGVTIGDNAQIGSNVQFKQGVTPQEGRQRGPRPSQDERRQASSGLDLAAR